MSATAEQESVVRKPGSSAREEGSGRGDVVADLLGDHLYRHHVAAAFQHDDVRVLTGGLDELFVHGFDGRQVLAHDGIQGAAPLLHVPHDAAQDTDVRVGIHKDLDVHKFPEGGVRENHDAIQDDDLGGADLGGLFGAVMDGVVVDRALHGLPRQQLAEMLHEQGRFEGVRVVVVQMGPFLVGQGMVGAIVVVVVDDADVVPEGLLQALGQGGLAGAGAAGDADDHGFHSGNPPFW